MTTDRQSAGLPVTTTGWHYIFDRYGTPTGSAVWREVGDLLPLPAVNGYDGPLHYQRGH